MTSVCFFQISDCSFRLGRARAPFKSFSPLFLRNLSLWHVCHFSQCSSESLQFSHNGSCWQVVRADSEYVWKTVKLVEKKLGGEEREPPYICNSMLNCKCILKMHRPPSNQVICPTMTAYVNIWSLKINVRLSLERSQPHYHAALFICIEMILPLMFNNSCSKQSKSLENMAPLIRLAFN